MATYCAINRREWKLFAVAACRQAAIFCVHFLSNVYNEVQLSLTHKQLKVGIANQRHPLTSSESSIAQFKKTE
jgi:hypothetical protein